MEKDNSIFMYADHTLLISEADNINEIRSKAQKALQSMASWCHANMLGINLEKTKFMVIKHTKVNAEPDLLLDNCKIGTVQQYEYL